MNLVSLNPFLKRAAFLIGSCSFLFSSGCSVFVTRPVQEMSDTAAAIRSAREVQAEVLTPELYRQANEAFYKARKEYRFKNFANAKELAKQARVLAEQAEFESIKIGGNRTGVSEQEFSEGLDVPPPPPMAPGPGEPSAGKGPQQPYSYPTPLGTPVESFEQRKKEEELRRLEPPSVTPSPSPFPGDLSTPIPVSSPMPFPPPSPKR